MKNNLPAEIYLQIYDEEDQEIDDISVITWCAEKIYETDIKYIRADKVKEMMDAKNELLVCYRLGRRPSEKLLDKLDKIQKEFDG
jgi:hypothetical protein